VIAKQLPDVLRNDLEFSGGTTDRKVALSTLLNITTGSSPAGDKWQAASSNFLTSSPTTEER